MGSGAAITLTLDELRVVARYAADAAQDVLPLYEAGHPVDPRPRAAIAAALSFVDGAPRTRLQRVASLDAHRAARAAHTEAARHAARAAGDAASAAYLHPLPNATQVGHILRAAASAAYATELDQDDPAAGDRMIQRVIDRATPALVDVLRRYPAAPTGRSRPARLMSRLDDALRAR